MLILSPRGDFSNGTRSTQAFFACGGHAQLLARSRDTPKGTVRFAVQPVISQTFHLVMGGRRQPGAAISVVADLVRAFKPNSTMG